MFKNFPIIFFADFMKFVLKFHSVHKFYLWISKKFSKLPVSNIFQSIPTICSKVFGHFLKLLSKKFLKIFLKFFYNNSLKTLIIIIYLFETFVPFVQKLNKFSQKFSIITSKFFDILFMLSYVSFKNTSIFLNVLKIGLKFFQNLSKYSDEHFLLNFRSFRLKFR